MEAYSPWWKEKLQKAQQHSQIQEVAKGKLAKYVTLSSQRETHRHKHASMIPVDADGHEHFCIRL